jgi:hypothetical protein
MRLRTVLLLIGLAIVAATASIAPRLIALRYHQRAMGRLMDAQKRMQHLANAILTYTEDNDERFPPAARWEDAIRKYTGESAATGSTEDGKLRRVTFNRALDGRSLADVPESITTVLFFESETTVPNAAADPSAMISTDPSGMFPVLFVSGSGYPWSFSSRQRLIDDSHRALQDPYPVHRD